MTMAAALDAIQSPVILELREVRERMASFLLSEFPFLDDIAAHVIKMQGKLLRPTLLLLGSRLEGKPSRHAVPLALAVEMIHTATLVHDDSIDRSSLRRGLPTVNTKWNDQVSIIMGDYLYSRSLMEMVRIGDLQVMEVLSEACRRIAVGEMKEIQLAGLLDCPEQEYYSMIGDKTAALLAASCEAGVLLAGGRERRALREYGENLGMAFQIVDDILDYLAAPEILGKPIGSDLRERKVTLPALFALRGASRIERLRIEEAFARTEVEEEDVRALTEIIDRRGGFAAARARARDFAEKAREALGGVADSPPRQALDAAVDYVVERER